MPQVWESTARPVAVVGQIAAVTGLTDAGMAAVDALLGYVRDGTAGADTGMRLGAIFGVVIGLFIAAMRMRAGVMDAPRRVPRVGDFVGGWQVLGMTARGGYRFEVRDALGRHGTLRLIDQRSDFGAGVAIQRLQYEASVLKSIDSEYVGKVLADGRIRNLYYLVTEYFAGTTLLRRVAPHGEGVLPLRDYELFQAARGTVAALAEIHGRHAVHEAVCPETVILRDHGIGGIAELGHRTPFELRNGSTVDSKGYAAPEGCGSAAADIYGWAASMVFAATGRHPMPAVAGGPGAPDLSECPEWIRPLLAEALDGDPDRRPEADALATRLDAIGERLKMSLKIPEPAHPARSDMILPRWLAGTLVLALADLLITAATLPTPARPVTVPPPAASTSAAPTTATTASATPTLQPATPTPTPTPTPSPIPTPTPTQPTTTAPVAELTTSLGPDRWPTDAQDGSPAMYAYFGASFYWPQWTSCDDRVCITSDGGPKVDVYTVHPIKQIAKFSSQVSSPYQQLLAQGFKPAEAKDLLKMD
ncbi:serine/threonine protein kinase [Catenulispora acidiphila DSM 44928]|uniref:non-specific serine/threonine protein kinase n=1 Tax=Catenulispora acidiphila (strain DSM 44928 / JCM 14897 / NBRC 102108 / NRRL B-24433 / ID139908) TaxID=479433 RepID=C7Q3L4_CATAD|nr:serine/threonine protein kinase [Catenulispora acidiphila]ACU75779.1 serine/threonine protein kinase [Catenulispora acidiphila DSM 44928]